MVEWGDAWVDDPLMGLNQELAEEHEPLIVKSAGFLVASTQSGVTIAREQAVGKWPYRGPQFIPKGNIISIREK